MSSVQNVKHLLHVYVLCSCKSSWYAIKPSSIILSSGYNSFFFYSYLMQAATKPKLVYCVPAEEGNSIIIHFVIVISKLTKIGCYVPVVNR